MTHGKLSTRALALGLAVVAAVGMLSGAQVPESTTAAWTDRTSASAVVTAGTWPVPAANSCTAYGTDGRKLPKCTVTSIRFDGWGEPGRQFRNYYIEIDASYGARVVTFDVDLASATGRGTSWSWKNAAVLLGAQFSPRDGWTCDDLPRVRGTGTMWIVDTIYIPITESSSGVLSRCS